ncbi:PaaI family thioesterase [Serinicoccus marinus]|uniref:PaaI family thioesterase n=1 Tax=Serinicoccus marinus TaxID=247333 RepID=UPI002492DE25|nr:PaaI family thioesterase [Serinicoccus marinus]
MKESPSGEEVLRSSNFSDLLGVEDAGAGPERVANRMRVSERLANRNGVLHGGALMSLVDHTAGTLALLSCPAGRTTVTVEGKTNFFRSARVGDTVTAVATPLHVGRTTMVVLVTTIRGDGKEMSVSMQTQLFVEWTS